jgi:hypothetical protein
MKKWVIWGLYGAFFGFIAYIFGAVWNLNLIIFNIDFTPICQQYNFCLGGDIINGALYFIVNVGLGFLLGIFTYWFIKQCIKILKK